MADAAVGELLARLDENPTVGPDDADGDDADGADWGNGVGERGLALGDLEPEVVDVLGAGLDAPGGEGVGGQPGLEPVGEGLRGGEAVADLGAGAGHGGDPEEPPGVQVARQKRDL